MPHQTSLINLLLMCLLHVSHAGIDKRQSSKVLEQQAQVPPKLESHASERKTGRCSYTFVLPQQRLTGTLCMSTVGNRSESASLRAELGRQQEQLERLRAELGPEGGLLGEMRALRGENGGLNARMTQLYAQLLQQIVHSKEQAVEQSSLEKLLLNTSEQLHKVSTGYKELERNFELLTSLVNNQSVMITRLEKGCRCTSNTTTGQATDSPHAGMQRPLNESREQSRDVQMDQDVAKAHPEHTTVLHTVTEWPLLSHPITKNPGPWQDCKHVLDSGEATSGIYLLRPRLGNRLLQAWCDHGHSQGGWTVIQRRQDGSVNFFRTWEQYKQGFGNLDGEYWLGLEHLYWLSSQANYRLRVLLEDWQGRQVFAEYDSFRLEPESDFYRLRLGDFQGTAGDSLSWHNNKAFTTLDRDRDAYTGNCAHYQKGGWWYHMCAHSNLNGVWYRGGHYRSRYQDGVYWAEFHGGSYSLKRVTMMIKPI